MSAYSAIEIQSMEKAKAYAIDYATKHPGVEVWVSEQTEVFYVAPGELSRRKYNSKGELLPT